MVGMAVIWRIFLADIVAILKVDADIIIVKFQVAKKTNPFIVSRSASNAIVIKYGIFLISKQSNRLSGKSEVCIAIWV